jgi:site-specific DNA recombinase
MHKSFITRKAKQEKSKYSFKYAVSDLMVCGECGHPYRRQTWSKYVERRGAWGCESRLKSGKRKL